MDAEPEEVHVRSLVLSACDLKQQGNPPSVRGGSASVTLGNRVYAYGGWSEQKVHDDLYVLEIGK